MSDQQSVEEQLRDWINQLAPEYKQMLMSMLIEDDRLRRAARLEFVVAQLRGLCTEHSLNWDAMVESEREQFLDSLVRDNELYSTQFGKSSTVSLAPCHQCGREVTPNDLYRIYFSERDRNSDREATVKLVVLDVEVETEFALATEEEAVIGRIDPHRGVRPTVDLSKFDPAARISRRHARITARGPQFFIEDLGSSNGTIINGIKRLKPEEPYPLANGDVIKIGDTTLKFVEHSV